MFTERRIKRLLGNAKHGLDEILCLLKHNFHKDSR